MLDVIVATTFLKEIQSDFSSNSQPTLYPIPRISPSVDPAQNNHNSRNVRQQQVHIIDRQTKDLKRLWEHEKH